MIFLPIIFNIFISMLVLSLLSIKLNIVRPVVMRTAGVIAVLSSLSAQVIYTALSGLSILYLILLAIVISLGISFLIIMLMFFRDPERNIPIEKGFILSPADGTVRYVKEIKEGEIAFSEKKGKKFPLKEITHTDIINNGAYVVGIEMSIIDVHVNRAPIAGTLNLIHSSPGKYLSLRNIDSVLENERVTTLFTGKDISIGVVQIASRIVRRIVVYKKLHDKLSAGERFGRITFGSQVDVIIPDAAGLKINVKQGDFVKAGTSVIAQY
ncbi:phosphatidylserine decarboxylase [bacterium]|nr:phosphatidylserine decarboxylase [bacterium]